MIQEISCEEYVIMTDIYANNNRKYHFEGTIQTTNRSPSIRRRSKCCYLFPQNKGIYENIPNEGGNGLIADGRDVMNIFIKDQNQDKYVNQPVISNFLTDIKEYNEKDYYRKPIKPEEILHDHNFSYLDEENFENFQERYDHFHIKPLSIENNLYNILEIVYKDNYIIRTECYVNQYKFEINNKTEFTAAYNETVAKMIVPAYIIRDNKLNIDWSKKDQKYINFKPYLSITRSTNMINKYAKFDGKSCFDYILSFRVG